ncbi:MAG TPA: branched-chain amino acid transport system II carrier protein [Eubacteriales bacterium]|nr:branched-chain amino acid transport system II carrier protein [Eubacteriales bacterium]
MCGKNCFKSVMVLGFALFAMFFGAGNLIFPPYLGLEGGTNWGWGFISFIVVDAGLAVIALISVFKTGKGFSGVTEKLGPVLSPLLIAVTVLCLGPLAAIPRTAATTFELGVQPLLPNCPSWISAVAFFSVVTLLCVRPAKIVDIVGRFLSPLMFLCIIALVVVGIVTPIGTTIGGAVPSELVREGLESGYQTMDMLGALLFSAVVLSSLKTQGYNDRRSQLRMTAMSGGVAALGMFLVYGGLSYLGASSSSVFSLDLGQAGLLLAITNGLLGTAGQVLLGVIVACACLTTAIGLVSACAESFVDLSHGKLKYVPMVLAISAFSLVVSTLGISKIIALSSPVLEIIYPVLMTLVLLTLANGQIKSRYVYRGAALFALVVSAYVTLDGLVAADLGSSMLPLAGIGLGWVLPAALGGLIGAAIKDRKPRRLPAHKAAKSGAHGA